MDTDEHGFFDKDSVREARRADIFVATQRGISKAPFRSGIVTKASTPGRQGAKSRKVIGECRRRGNESQISRLLNGKSETPHVVSYWGRILQFHSFRGQ
jgi:hypothetical protein